MPERKAFFVSYAHEDRAFVDRLMAALKSILPKHIDLLRIEDVLKPGEDLVSGISEAISKSSGVIFVLPKSAQSSWLATELGMALAEERRDRPFRVFPVAADSDRYVPHLLRDRLRLEFSGVESFDANAKRLAIALLTEGLLERAERSISEIQEVISEQQKEIEERNKELETTVANESRFLSQSLFGVLASAVIGAFIAVALIWQELAPLPITTTVATILAVSIGYWLGRISELRSHASRNVTKSSPERSGR